jgi:hypothetical protein
MIDLLVSVLIGVLVLGLVWWLIDYLPVPEPLNRIAKIIIVVIAVIWLIYVLLGLSGHAPRLGRM